MRRISSSRRAEKHSLVARSSEWSGHFQHEAVLEGLVSQFGFIFPKAIGRAIARRYPYLLEESPGSGEQAAR